MLATIAVKGMKFFAYHGLYDYEREKGGWYTVDVEVTADITTAATDRDELEGTVNYELIYRSVEEIMKTPSQLIEHLAHRVVLDLRRQFPEVDGVKVTVHKHQPPLGGEVEETSVTILG